MNERPKDNLGQAKNRFLREIEAAPKSDKASLILLWSIEDKTFCTRQFHPKKVHHRIAIEDVLKVDSFYGGYFISQNDQTFQRLHGLETRRLDTDSALGSLTHRLLQNDARDRPEVW